ncbi:hypothetical protein [Actinomadura sp. 9N407]|uniref:hypothetical protein n=1 Tax=Actinomadura sp. 9N407 TaxID=3375154 RepID=UPI0037B51313
MTDATTEFAEYGATALDSYQNLFEHAGRRDHRADDRHASELVGDLLADLMHYTDHRGLDFDEIVRTARNDFLRELSPEPPPTLGTLVRIKGPLAEEAHILGQPTLGAVTGLVVPHRGNTEYYVRRMGELGSQQYTGDDLEPAPPFPSVPTSTGIVDNPLRAEELLVDATVRSSLTTAATETSRPDDVREHRALLTALASWNGLDEQAAKDLLLAKVADKLKVAEGSPGQLTPIPPRQPATNEEPANPARLAAQAFPPALEQDVTPAEPSRPAASNSRTSRRSPAL